MGVDPDKDAEIIKPMVRLDNARSSEGSVLGLALLRAVADHHGAQLELGPFQSGKVPPGLAITLNYAKLLTSLQPTVRQHSYISFIATRLKLENAKIKTLITKSKAALSTVIIFVIGSAMAGLDLAVVGILALLVFATIGLAMRAAPFMAIEQRHEKEPLAAQDATVSA